MIEVYTHQVNCGQKRKMQLGELEGKLASFIQLQNKCSGTMVLIRHTNILPNHSSRKSFRKSRAISFFLVQFFSLRRLSQTDKIQYTVQQQDVVLQISYLFVFRYVPYVGIVTILMNDYPKFKVSTNPFIMRMNEKKVTSLKCKIRSLFFSEIVFYVKC